MTYKTISLAVEDGVARITLNRPEAANAMSIEMAQELMRAAIVCDEDPSVRAAVITGTGKMFCAGGDLKSFAGFGDEIGPKLKEMTAYLHAAISRFVRMNAPLIAAVNGTAAGAGLSLAMAADIVIASEQATFTSAYTAAGLSPDGSSTYFLPRLIGLRRTQELMLTNRRLSAQEALEWGLVTRIATPDRVASEAMALAADLARGPTLAFGALKKLLSETFTMGLEGQMEWEAREIARMAGTRDGREGIAAFVEKRRPNFEGT